MIITTSWGEGDQTWPCTSSLPWLTTYFNHFTNTVLCQLKQVKGWWNNHAKWLNTKVVYHKFSEIEHIIVCPYSDISVRELSVPFFSFFLILSQITGKFLKFPLNWKSFRGSISQWEMCSLAFSTSILSTTILSSCNNHKSFLPRGPAKIMVIFMPLSQNPCH